MDRIPEEIAEWIGTQPVFFVATASADPDTHVNVSPRGLDTFRVLGPNRVAWLDLTGSGVETIAHLKADDRITVVFCAFSGRPRSCASTATVRFTSRITRGTGTCGPSFPRCRASGP